jgi:hypothetical protein
VLPRRSSPVIAAIAPLPQSRSASARQVWPARAGPAGRAGTTLRIRFPLLYSGTESAGLRRQGRPGTTYPRPYQPSPTSRSNTPTRSAPPASTRRTDGQSRGASRRQVDQMRRVEAASGTDTARRRDPLLPSQRAVPRGSRAARRGGKRDRHGTSRRQSGWTRHLEAASGMDTAHQGGKWDRHGTLRR